MTEISETGRRHHFLHIGDAASITGLTQRTLRFYEERGLLHPPERMQGGFRLYSPADIERLVRIKQLKELLGFSLSEIAQMLDADELADRAYGREGSKVPSVGSEAARDALRRQLALIDQKMQGMTRLREQIAARLREWDGACD